VRESPSRAQLVYRRLADAEPPLIRGLGLEATREEVRRDRLVVVADRRALVPSAHAGHEALLLHQPNDPLATDMLVVGLEVLEDPRAAVVRAPELERLAQPRRTPIRFLRSRLSHPISIAYTRASLRTVRS
jgi:hypothetical protein